MIGEVELHEV
jgi:hypothetical protein